VDEKLTIREIPLLPARFNLTDGHAFRDWTPAESAIIDRAPELFRRVDRTRQREIEAQYIERLMCLTGQSYDPDSLRYLICTTASESIEIVANFLRLRDMSLALIEPCFDNIADIFRRHWLRMHPVSDTILVSTDARPRLPQVPCSAICLITPNNPTGSVLTAGSLEALIEVCAERDMLLILDTCFRAYVPDRQVYDQYRMLRDSGINFLVVEDTGKTWPTMELKASVLAMNASLYDAIFDIYSDFLLHVSPFTITLLTEFVNLSISDRCAAVRDVVASNRKALYRALEGTGLVPTEKPHASVSWIDTGARNAGDLVRRLEENGVFVLAGNRFFWSAPEKGDRFLRVALVRPTGVFAEACDALAETLARSGK
jgi:aspartate/methionine/tyrosine aminotransferase